MNIRLSKVISLLGASALVLSGCSTMSDNTKTSESQNALQVSELQNALQAKERENEELKDSLTALQANNKQVPSTQSPTNNGDLLPPNAKSGECYARAWVPAKYRDVSEKVLVSEASERVTVMPAKYRWTEKQVLVKPASSTSRNIPAVYTTEKKRIKIRDAVRTWRTALGKNAPPANDALLNTAKAHGIDLDTAKPGMCFHEHYIPATYERKEQQVLVSEGSQSVQTTAAKYRWVEKKILVKDASTEIQEVPAAYKWVEKKVIDKPKHTIWQKGTGPIQRVDELTGEIMCLVEVPATYRTIRQRVLATPATTRKVEIPAEYKTVKVRELVEDVAEIKTNIPAKYQTIAVTDKVADAKFVWHEIHNTDHPSHTRTGNKICLTERAAQYKTVTQRVIKTPATTRKVEIPAEYKTVKVRKLASPAQEKNTTIPAEYKTITRKELASDGYMEWRPILCKTNMTGTRISRIQQALKKAGYNPGPIDGVIGEDTMAAVNAFQRAKGLPVDKYLNIATLKALGVSAR